MVTRQHTHQRRLGKWTNVEKRVENRVSDEGVPSGGTDEREQVSRETMWHFSGTRRENIMNIHSSVRNIHRWSGDVVSGVLLLEKREGYHDGQNSYHLLCTIRKLFKVYLTTYVYSSIVLLTGFFLTIWFFVVSFSSLCVSPIHFQFIYCYHRSLSCK